MDVLQVWLVMGIPGLALTGAMFFRRSPWMSLIGYAAVFATFGGMAVYHRASAAVFASLAALLYAAGRGGAVEGAQDRTNEEGVPDAALLPSRRSTA